MERKLRISGYKDYVAIDEVQDNKVIATPFYLKKGETKQVKYKDAEEGKWFKTEVSIINGFKMLSMKDVDNNSDFTGMEWESPFEELLDKNQIAFL